MSGEKGTANTVPSGAHSQNAYHKPGTAPTLAPKDVGLAAPAAPAVSSAMLAPVANPVGVPQQVHNQASPRDIPPQTPPSKVVLSNGNHAVRIGANRARVDENGRRMRSLGEDGVGGKVGEAGSRKRRGTAEFDTGPEGVDGGGGDRLGVSSTEGTVTRMDVDGREANSIVAFSPYAARLGGGAGGGGGGEACHEDVLARATSRLEELRVAEAAEDHHNLQSPAKKHQVEKGSSVATVPGFPGRADFFRDMETPVPPLGTPSKAMSPVSVSPDAMVDGTDDGTPDEGDGALGAKASATDGVGLVAMTEDEEWVESPKALGRHPSSPTHSKGRTLLVYPPECQLHMTGDGYENHQERPERLELLCGSDGALRRRAFQDLEWAEPDVIKPAVITDLLRVHEFDYLQHIQERCRGAPPVAPRLPPSSSSPMEADDDEVDRLVPLSSPGRTRKPPRTAKSGAEVASETSSCPNPGYSDGGRAFRGHRLVDEPSRGSNSTSMISCIASASMRNSMQGEQEEFGQRFRPDPGYMDVDTRVSRESYGAARMAAGAVIHAVDRVVQGANPNAFVAVRPPGHHAGPCGSVPSPSFWKHPGMNSSGFCLLNNAAIGAAYAMSRYGRSGELARVAIVDIDIHHGNGTEEIVRCLRPLKTRLPLPPSWPTMTRTIYKPWLDDEDADKVFFGSVSLQNKGSFYPASGTESENYDNNHNIVNVSLSALGPPPGEEPKKRALTKTKMNEYMGKAGAEFKKKCEEVLLPRLRDFRPDLLVISAGFDGHVEDYYHYLSNESYEWITRELEACCPSGRVVSVLEGGYSLEARVSRARAAQQARAHHKRAEMAHVTAHSSSNSSSGSGPILRERRSRPPTRGSMAPVAVGGAKSGAPSSSSVLALASTANPAPGAPVPAASLKVADGNGSNGKALFSSSASSDSPGPSPDPSTSSSSSSSSLSLPPLLAASKNCAVGTASADAAFRRGLDGSGKACFNAGVTGGGDPVQVPRVLEPGSPVRVVVPQGSAANPAVVGTVKEFSKKFHGSSSSSWGVPRAPAHGEEALDAPAPVLSPTDGGLVCGAVSHVMVLIALASQKEAGGDGAAASRRVDVSR